MTASNQPAPAFYRENQILGDKKNPPIFPVSRSTWWAGVRSGRYPQPVKLSERTTAWRRADIEALIEKLGA